MKPESTRGPHSSKPQCPQGPFLCVETGLSSCLNDQGEQPGGAEAAPSSASVSGTLAGRPGAPNISEHVLREGSLVFHGRNLVMERFKCAGLNVNLKSITELPPRSHCAFSAQVKAPSQVWAGGVHWTQMDRETEGHGVLAFAQP